MRPARRHVHDHRRAAFQALGRELGMSVWVGSTHPKSIASARLTMVAVASLLIGSLSPYSTILAMVWFTIQPQAIRSISQPFLVCCLTLLSIGTIRSYWRARAWPASLFLTAELLLIWGLCLVGWRWSAFWSVIAGGSMQGVRQLPPWLPLWCLVGLAVFALIGSLAIRWKRPRSGICIGCGYDLTGLTTSRCPECGQAFESLSHDHG